MNDADPPREIVFDSSAATETLKRGNLAGYWSVFTKRPGLVLLGVWDTFRELTRYLFWPRFPLRASMPTRFRLAWSFLVAELRIPGATTLLETLWLHYASSLATNDSPNWLEVGCFKGLSSARLSLVAALEGRRLVVCDTFEGLPGTDAVYEPVDGGTRYHFQAKSYAGTEEEVRRNVAKYGRSDCVTLVKGNIDESLRAQPLPSLRFAFFDVDLEESYRSCFRSVAACIGAGTVIVVHEAGYAPIRTLIENREFWDELGCAPPTITLVSQRYGVRSCRNLAILAW